MSRRSRALIGALAALAVAPAAVGAQEASTEDPLLAAPAPAPQPCNPADVSFMTGLEHGRTATNAGWPFSTGVNTGGNGFADTVAPRSGAYSLHLQAGGAGAVYRGRVTDWKPVHVARFALRLNALPTTNVSELYGVYGVDSPRSALHIGYNAATQSLTLRQRPNPAVVASTPVVAGQWYVVEAKYDVGTNPHRATLRIDGSVAAESSLSAKPTYLNEAIWGTTFSDRFDASYDDLAISQEANASPIGDGHIYKLSPNETADGTHSGVANFRDVSASLVASPISSSTWQGLNEVPMDQPGRHIAQINNSSSSYVQVGFEDTSEECIKAVYGWMSYDPQNTSSTNNGKTVAVDGGVQSTIYSGLMSYAKTTTMRTKGAVVPASGGSWTRDDVNALTMRVGFSTDTSPRPWWDSLMFEYEVGG